MRVKFELLEKKDPIKTNQENVIWTDENKMNLYQNVGKREVEFMI